MPKSPHGSYHCEPSFAVIGVQNINGLKEKVKELQKKGEGVCITSSTEVKLSSEVSGEIPTLLHGADRAD